jgi:hypothetical protein
MTNLEDILNSNESSRAELIWALYEQNIDICIEAIRAITEHDGKKTFDQVKEESNRLKCAALRIHDLTTQLDRMSE